MKTINQAALIATLIFLSSCSNPFGGKPLVEAITDKINDLFGKTTTEMVSGGTHNYITEGKYKVSVSIGNYASQDEIKTSGGYKVMANVKAE